MLREGQVPHDAAWFYCVSSAIYFSIFVLSLFFTKAYLYAGKNVYLPVYIFLITAELLKYAYIQHIFYKDFTYSSKQGFKLFGIIFYFLKQIKLVELIRGILVLAGFTCIVFVISIFFGAEVLAQHEETLMFSCLVTLLTAYPVCLHQGVASLMQFISGIYGNDTFTQVLLRNIQFTSMGAWFGAFVIPLDWDREWQIWPIPCSLGAMIGYTASQCVCILELLTKFSGGKFSKSSNKYR